MYYPRLKDLREDNDLKQKEIAAFLGIDQRVYSNYETGKREIPVHLLLKLAEYYHTSTDYILGLTDDPYTERSK
ncbi:helix-turn-helix domain-containing protein [bacterium 210917-DFI.7.65]|nr:helix-turn-helix transcriptional regulator [Clostridiales bacterium]MCB6898764.1 helix-turn-helix domain-containing protein [bacterium 210917-DFI.7.65]